MHPIWLRKEVTLGTGSDYEFYITKDAAEIYRGRAYKRPGETSVKIVLNDICRDYLAALPATGGLNIPADDESEAAATVLPIAAEFKTYLSSGTLKDTTTFLLDWSYDAIRASALSARPASLDLGAPIIPEHNAALPYLYTVPTARSVDYDNGEEEISATLSGAGAFALSAALFAEGDAYAFYDDAKAATVTVPLKRYCGEWYALVYLNAYGGWDQLTCDGRSLHSRSYERRTIVTPADNAQTGIRRDRRGESTYGITEAERWQLSTPFLTDAQAARMHHLLGSLQVWLISSADTSHPLPVIIETDTVETKTRRNQEGGMVAYSFAVKLAEDRQR